MKRSALGHFLALPPAERWLLWRAAWQLQFSWLKLRFVQFEKLQRRLLVEPTIVSERSVVSAERIAELVRSLSWRMPWTNTCLVRALTIAVLLRENGFSAKLCLGAKKEGGEELRAHAWIEDESGRVLAEELADLQEFQRLSGFGSQPSDKQSGGTK